MTLEPQQARAEGTGALAVEVTPDCNRTCMYCYNSWRRTPEQRDRLLPAAEFVALVERALGESGRGAIQFSGGEPLLRPDFFDIVEGLKRPGRPLSLVTDGGLIDASVADRIKAAGLAPIQPTLLAADRALHDRLKGSPGAFDATVKAIGLLVQRNVPVTVSFVATRDNGDALDDVVQLCFALGVRTLALSRFCTAGVGSEHQAELQPTVAQLRRCFDVAIEARRVYGMAVHVAISAPLCLPTDEQRRQLRFGRCALGTAQPGFTIDPWGRLRACSVSEVTLGDLRSESWADVMARANQDYFPAIRALPDGCSNCRLAAQCGGGCRESARLSSGGLDAPDPLATV